MATRIQQARVAVMLGLLSLGTGCSMEPPALGQEPGHGREQAAPSAKELQQPADAAPAPSGSQARGLLATILASEQASAADAGAEADAGPDAAPPPNTKVPCPGKPDVLCNVVRPRPQLPEIRKPSSGKDVVCIEAPLWAIEAASRNISQSKRRGLKLSMEEAPAPDPAVPSKQPKKDGPSDAGIDLTDLKPRLPKLCASGAKDAFDIQTIKRVELQNTDLFVMIATHDSCASTTGGKQPFIIQLYQANLEFLKKRYVVAEPGVLLKAADNRFRIEASTKVPAGKMPFTFELSVFVTSDGIEQEIYYSTNTDSPDRADAMQALVRECKDTSNDVLSVATLFAKSCQ